MAQYPETSRNRRRVSIEKVGSAWSEVPTDRLCPSGVPNEAMGRRVPDRRMVPTLSWRTRVLHSRRECQRDTNANVQSTEDHYVAIASHR